MSSQDLYNFFDHIFVRQGNTDRENRRTTPLCIWGNHGIGKTSVVESYAQDRGWQFAYCAPAQFEEVGDLHGLPIQGKSKAKNDDGPVTNFAPPAWVPSTPGPGILLLDDLNRADDRMLRALMQLLQRHELFSWSLPPNWHIVVTANPDNSDYSVTPLDAAMLTRMLHVSLTFDLRSWARWANNQGVDHRGIDFVLHYPELIDHNRTTPRELVNFFDLIEPIIDLKMEMRLVHSLAFSCLDELTANTFMGWLERDDNDGIPDAREILKTRDPESMLRKIQELAVEQGRNDGRPQRIDRINLLCERIVLHLSAKKYRLRPTHWSNIKALLKSPIIPGDLRWRLCRDITGSNPRLAALIKKEGIAKRLEALVN